MSGTTEPTPAEMATVKDKEHGETKLEFGVEGIGVVIPAFLTKQETRASQGYIPIKIRITKPDPAGNRSFVAQWVPSGKTISEDSEEDEYRVVRDSPGKALDALISKLNK